MLLFLDIGGGELLLIILVGMLLFGTDKLPGIIRGIAKGTDYIKKASEEVREQITRETGLDDAINDVKETVSKTANDISEGFDPDFKTPTSAKTFPYTPKIPIRSPNKTLNRWLTGQTSGANNEKTA